MTSPGKEASERAQLVVQAREETEVDAGLVFCTIRGLSVVFGCMLLRCLVGTAPLGGWSRRHPHAGRMRLLLSTPLNFHELHVPERHIPPVRD
jgi:hypothetical protein